MPTPATADELATATGREVTDSAQLQYEKMLRAMRREPLQAVAIAAGVGFVLALLFLRR